MTTDKKYEYEEGDEAPGIYVAPMTDNEDGSRDEHGVWWVNWSGENIADDQETAEKMRQEYALAIADNVHGAELKALRARVHEQHEIHCENVRGMMAVLMHLQPASTPPVGGPGLIDLAKNVEKTVADLRARIEKAIPLAMRLEDATDADPHVAKGELVTCAAALLAALKGPA